MQMALITRPVALLVAGLQIVVAHRSGLKSGYLRASGRSAVRDLAFSESRLQASVSDMVAQMIHGKSPGVHDLVNSMHSRMALGDAVSRLDGKLPVEVASLVHLSATSGSANSRANYDDASLQKARKILNNMMFKAWGELDDVIFECKEFQARNRGTFQQVMSDLARLGSQLAKLSVKRVGAAQGIGFQDSKRKEVEGVMQDVTQEYKRTLYENNAKMTIARNDLAVFDFVLRLTSCSNSGSLLQLGANKEDGKVKVCSAEDGMELRFDDAKLQAQVERMMTPDAKMALREALGQMTINGPMLLEVGASRQPNSTATAPPSFGAMVVPVSEDPHPAGQWKKCVDGTPDCGLLHDLMSLEWGKFRDSFDELAAEMKKNQQQFEMQMSNLNAQMTAINDEKTKQMETLADSISNINADTQEKNEKDEQRRELTLQFDSRCAVFRSQIAEILFTKICAVRRVRNELMSYSSSSPPDKISDCDFSDWASKTGQCFDDTGAAIRCDDTCPQPDPYKCGGWETLSRDVVVSPDADGFGMRCPALERKMKCGQKKCEVDCVMSEWSGWSKCTKQCESGVQARTRSVLTKPKNGGMGCDSVQEERSCNTQSCDRNCVLQDWSDWAPCSVACGGGLRARRKGVLVPIRGMGKCPTQSSRNRFEEIDCNTQGCVGDEMCIARQDLIISIDASGSLKEDGFAIIQNLSMKLVGKYRSKYYGDDAMRIGVNMFGNGQLMTSPDGTTSISSAVNVISLTADMAAVVTKIKALTWQKGFTNMAQALSLADAMLGRNGRPGAQSAVMVLSDGKYSFAYQTAEKARELKDKNVELYMAPITDFEGKELENLKDWASQPWETNYERIPGLAALKFNTDLFVQKLIVKFCPDSMSPSKEQQQDTEKQYMLIHENGWPDDACGTWYYHGVVTNKDDCVARTRTKGQMAFAYGRSYAENRCYSENIQVTLDNWKAWMVDRSAPACSGGDWLLNPFYDTYAINPLTVVINSSR